MKVLITGSEGGLGSHLSQRMKSLGHNVCGMDIKLSADVRPQDGPDFLGRVKRVLDGFPQAVVMCAGVTEMARTEYHHLPMFIHVIQNNLIEQYSIIHQMIRVAPFPTRFVAVGSASAHQAMSRSHGYVASKAALEALMRCLARDCTARTGHTFFTVAPGMIKDTKMTERAVVDVMNRGDVEVPDIGEALKYLVRNPLDRMTTKDEVCDLIEFCLFKATEASSGATFKLPMASGVE